MSKAFSVFNVCLLIEGPQEKSNVYEGIYCSRLMPLSRVLFSIWPIRALVILAQIFFAYNTITASKHAYELRIYTFSRRIYDSGFICREPLDQPVCLLTKVLSLKREKST